MIKSLAIRATSMMSRGLTIALILMILPITALGQETGSSEATAIAVAYGEIAADAKFDTLAADNSELDAEALERVKQELANRGHGVDQEAPLVMLVDMILVRAEGQDQKVEVPRTGTEAPIGEGDNVFSSERSTLLNRLEVPRSGHLLRLDVSVYDRKSGLYLWRGQIFRDGLDVQIEAAAERMVPALLGHLGQTLEETKIPLE